MENVTPGLEGSIPMGVRSQKTVDGIRFMIMNRGTIEMMFEKADTYFIDIDDNILMYRLTDEDFAAREFDEDEIARVKEHCEYYHIPGLNDEFYNASRRL